MPTQIGNSSTGGKLQQLEWRSDEDPDSVWSMDQTESESPFRPCNFPPAVPIWVQWSHTPWSDCSGCHVFIQCHIHLTDFPQSRHIRRVFGFTINNLRRVCGYNPLSFGLILKTPLVLTTNVIQIIHACRVHGLSMILFFLSFFSPNEKHQTCYVILSLFFVINIYIFLICMLSFPDSLSKSK